MFNLGDRVLVCVSGGPDSVALTHILLSLAPEYRLQLGIAHLNHGLRPEDAERDASFVTSLARELALPIYTDKQDVFAYRQKYHLSLEEAARRIRYHFFSTVAEKYGFRLRRHYLDLRGVCADCQKKLMDKAVRNLNTR